MDRFNNKTEGTEGRIRECKDERKQTEKLTKPQRPVEPSQKHLVFVSLVFLQRGWDYKFK